MTSPFDDEIFDDLFHGCAFAAYLEQAWKSGTWPSSDKTRQRAYQLYEEALAKRAVSREST